MYKTQLTTKKQEKKYRERKRERARCKSQNEANISAKKLI